MEKYNFVFFLEAFFEYNKIIYAEIGERPNVKNVFGFYPKNKILRILYQLQHSKTTNKIFRLPFKSIWFNTYFKNDFIDQNKPIVFIFDARLLSYDYIRDYVVWLRKKYPGCKLVVNYIDIVATWPDCAKPDAIRGLFDMLVSYDRDDADKYNMYYHPTVYAEAKILKPNNKPETDVFFVGGAKNRMKIILETYDRLEKAGLKCFFYVMDAKPPYNQERSGIRYVTEKTWLSYEECVQYVQHTKCVLEIMQQGAKGETLRVWEAITYGKMLLTNNLFMTKSRFYDPDYVCLISENGDFDTQRIKDYVCKPNPFKDKVLPETLLKYIAENL
ncbi:MAG: hypothetical protein U0K66_05900 [Paludibacteraceae bacterium]|nr:hypothetical protein [Paludibacteraceae bacterium]